MLEIIVNLETFDKFVRALLLWVGILLLSGPFGFAQGPQAPKSPATPPPSAKPKSTQPKEPEKEITPEEAKQLFQAVDEILRFASEDSKLPIRGPVKRELMSRSQFHDYLVTKMDEDPDTQRFRRTEAVLRKLGLVPRDFDLRTFLVRMLEEQVEGFYDPKSKTMYLLNWVQPDLQEPVLAHELTHALQDQNFDLDRWSDVVPEPTGKKPVKSDPYKIEPDEARAARQSVSEGQAMMVMLDYILAPSGRSVADAPSMAEMFKQETLDQTKDSPILQSAPMYIRESLLFSYTFGLSFEQRLLADGGKQLAFDAALRVPPANTHEIMTPQAYLDREKLPPMPFPRIVPAVEKNYQSYDSGEVGQFDVYVLLKQFGDQKLADELAPKWRGGLYWVVVRPNRHLDESKAIPASDLAVFYLSRWASPEDATRFAQLYSSWLGKRYREVGKGTAMVPGKDVHRVADANLWNTEDGPVYIEPLGQTVLVMESFDAQTAAEIRDIVKAHPPDAVSEPNRAPEGPAPKPLTVPPAASHPLLFLHP